jgi:hypothetical protein
MKKSRIKPSVIILLILAMLFNLSAAGFSADTTSITVILDSEELDFDVSPYINGDSRTIVEARGISEALGAEILWDEASQTVTIIKDGNTVELVIGQATYWMNGSQKTMDTAPIIIDGRTMVPLRFVSQALGLTVGWDGETNTVNLSDDISTANETSYTLVTTGQSDCYDQDGTIISPEEGEAYYGQDGNYASAAFSLTDNGDGTVTDNTTGLMWQVIPISEQMTWEDAVAYCESLELAGYDDWRIPSLKEAFSISDFETGWPYLDTDYFEFPEASDAGPAGDGGPQGGTPQGDSESGETMPPPPTDDSSDQTEGSMPPPPAGEGEDSDGISKAQGQFWTSNYYEVGTTHDGAASAFGVNHATGHIKAYPADTPSQMGKYVRAVRGDAYGINEFTDNGDGTITDQATGLMWMSADIGQAMDWDDALAYAESASFAGYDDWRLPDVKELQSIVDYSGLYPAIDDSYFSCTELSENEFYYYWTSTSAYFSTSDPGYGYAWYVAFGYAVDDEGNDTHGAGAVRFSPKYEGSAYAGEGGDNILNSVRLVRNISE